MPTAILGKTISIGGVSFTSREEVTNGGVILLQETLVAAKAGTLSTRTGNTEGIITSNGHAMTTGTVSVYWTVSGFAGKRNGMTISTGDTNTITLTGGTGDNFPAQTSAVTIFNDVVLSCVFTGTDANVIVAHCTDVGAADFSDAGGSELLLALPAGTAYEWLNTSGAANPVTGDDIITVTVSHKAIVPATVTVGVLYETI